MLSQIVIGGNHDVWLTMRCECDIEVKVHSGL